MFLVMFDGFGCSCGLPHCVIHVQRLSLSEFTALGKFKKKTKHHSKLFMLNSYICKSYRRSESKYYFFLLKASLCMQLDQVVAIIGHGVNLFGKPGINQGYMCEKKRD